MKSPFVFVHNLYFVETNNETEINNIVVYIKYDTEDYTSNMEE